MERTGKNNSIYENKLDLHTLFIYEKKKIMLSSKQIRRSLSNHSLLTTNYTTTSLIGKHFSSTNFFQKYSISIPRFHPFQETSNPRLSYLNVTKNTVKKNDRGDERSNGSATRNSRTIVTESRYRQWTIEEKRRRWCVSRCARRNIAACNGHWRRACSPGPF